MLLSLGCAKTSYRSGTAAVFIANKIAYICRAGVNSIQKNIGHTSVID